MSGGRLNVSFIYLLTLPIFGHPPLYSDLCVQSKSIEAHGRLTVHCLYCVFFSAKYPEIKQLMGHDPYLKYVVTAMVFVQIFSAYLLRDASWVVVVVASYVWGGVINHSMALAIHEISHNLAFSSKRPWANRALGMFGNLVIGVPFSIAFRKYHQVG